MERAYTAARPKSQIPNTRDAYTTYYRSSRVVAGKGEKKPRAAPVILEVTSRSWERKIALGVIQGARSSYRAPARCLHGGLGNGPRKLTGRGTRAIHPMVGFSSRCRWLRCFWTCFFGQRFWFCLNVQSTSCCFQVVRAGYGKTRVFGRHASFSHMSGLGGCLVLKGSFRTGSSEILYRAFVAGGLLNADEPFKHWQSTAKTCVISYSSKLGTYLIPLIIIIDNRTDNFSVCR